MLTPELNTFTGLSNQEAITRLRADGLNELASAKSQNLWKMAWHVVTEPMLLLLIACASLYLILGDWHEALVLSGFVVAMLSISFYQEHKTERALEALRDLSTPKALVIRDGSQISIPSNQVVCGDLLIIGEGDRVAADGIIVSALNLRVDESLLTGESVPVDKEAEIEAIEHEAVTTERIMQDEMKRLKYVFSGSLVVQGKANIHVCQTGNNTAIGKIGQAIASVHEEPTRVQKETQKVVKFVAIFSIALAILLACWYGYTRSDWIRGALVGLSFAMAMIPAELPIVLSIFLGIGAWRIAQKQVLTKRIPAIETLGAATVLCVDKTGTLTQNRMAVAEITTGQDNVNCANVQVLPEAMHEVLEYAILASQSRGSEPMDQALQMAGQTFLKDTEHLHKDWSLVEEYPLSKELLAMSRAWEDSDRALKHFVIASKGAPEAIADLCHIDATATARLMEQVNAMAARGLRVLAVAKATHSTEIGKEKDLPPQQHDFDFQLLGLVAFADPIRDDVPSAIKECQSAGIRVVMITGDYPATAISIAKQCGINTEAGVLNGKQILTLSDSELTKQLQEINVYCRVMPDQKLRIVRLLMQSGEIVAMTGDGVNDAPALKAANIGIAMGKRGTDVARESAALVLLDDAFSAIVAAVRLGRRIFDNLRKTLSFVIAAHLPIIGLSFLPVMLGLPILLMPVHILILELIIDPSCSLAFEAEPEEGAIMQIAPRALSASIFQTSILWRGLSQGAAMLLIEFGIYWVAIQHAIPTDETRGITFIAIVLGNLGFIFLNRSLNGNLRHAFSAPNPIIWWVCGITVGIMALLFTIPTLRHLFYFGNPQPQHLLMSVLTALIALSVIGLIQQLLLRKRNTNVD